MNLKQTEEQKYTKIFFSKFRLYINRIEGTGSPFTACYGVKSKHDSVIATSPVDQDLEEHYLWRYFSKEFITTKIPTVGRI